MASQDEYMYSRTPEQRAHAHARMEASFEREPDFLPHAFPNKSRTTKTRPFWNKISITSRNPLTVKRDLARVEPVGGKRTRKIRRKRTRKNRRNKRKHTRHFRK